MAGAKNPDSPKEEGTEQTTIPRPILIREKKELLSQADLQKEKERKALMLKRKKRVT